MIKIEEISHLYSEYKKDEEENKMIAQKKDAAVKKVSKLKGVAPEKVVASRPKFMISGESGKGKTWFALDFPKPYFLDCEGGATREQYQQKLIKSGGVYLGKEQGSQDFDVIINEIKNLILEEHDYQTLIIDSFTYLYLLEAAKAELEGGSDFGRDKKEANKPTRQLMRWLDKLDMTVIIICHSKTKWKKRGKELYSEGNTFDGYDKLEFILDLWIEIVNHKYFVVKKSRIENLQQDTQHELKYEKFAGLYGKEAIERKAVPLKLARPEQVERIKSLLEIIKVDDSWESKVFAKAGVDSWEEMSENQIQKYLDSCDKKIKSLSKEVK